MFYTILTPEKRHRERGHPFTLPKVKTERFKWSFLIDVYITISQRTVYWCSMQINHAANAIILIYFNMFI